MQGGTNQKQQVSERTVERLSLYRRLLSRLRDEAQESVFSHELAAMAGVTAVQVRRDLMSIGYSGSPTSGYAVEGLIESIGRFLDAPGGQRAALIGVGNLGRAILTFFSHRRPKLSIVAAFDSDPGKVGRVISGCRCYPIAELAQVVQDKAIDIGVITVPATVAQEVADLLTRSGVKGLLNLAPVRLRVPANVPVEDLDITMSLEKVAYLTRQRKG